VRVSIDAKRPLEAIFTTYGAILGYLFLSSCIPGLNLWFKILGPGYGHADLLAWHAEVLASLPVYVAAHVGIAVYSTGVAVQHLRQIARRAKAGVVEDDPAGTAEAPGLPEIPAEPVALLLWKERHVEKNLISDQQVLACLGVPLVFYLFSTVVSGAFTGEGERTLRIIGMCFACPLPLLVGLSAAGRISREFERHTLDSLLTATFDRNTLLIGKAWASVTGVSHHHRHSVHHLAGGAGHGSTRLFRDAVPRRRRRHPHGVRRLRGPVFLGRLPEHQFEP